VSKSACQFEIKMERIRKRSAPDRSERWNQRTEGLKGGKKSKKPCDGCGAKGSAQKKKASQGTTQLQSLVVRILLLVGMCTGDIELNKKGERGKMKKKIA